MPGDDVASREVGTELVAYGREVVGSNLRAVTRYDADEHEPLYTREDVPDRLDLDEGTRAMFRYPLVRMQTATQELARHHPTLDSPDAAVYDYGDVLVLQFPITDRGGVIVTLDWDGALPDEFVSGCKSVVSGSR